MSNEQFQYLQQLLETVMENVSPQHHCIKIKDDIYIVGYDFISFKKFIHHGIASQ